MLEINRFKQFYSKEHIERTLGRLYFCRKRINGHMFLDSIAVLDTIKAYDEKKHMTGE